MFYLLSKTLDLAFSPLCWALVLAASAVLVARRGRARAARTQWLSAALAFYLPASGFGATLLWDTVVRFEGRRADPTLVYDAVIVLGGFAHRRSDGGIELADGVERLFGAFDLLRQGRARRALITSGCSQGGCESELIAELLVEMGIARERLIVGKESANTRDNALEARKWMRRAKLSRVVLVTSAFHMQRALETFRAVGLAPDALAVDYSMVESGTWMEALSPRASNLDKSGRALRELAGRVVYRVLGYAQRAP